jgi:chemotaxis protein methyltransferase CheR
MDSLRISLVTRATRFGFTDYRDYFRLLSADDDEFKELMNLVTINETSFFRFPAQFDALRDRIIPEIVDARGAGATREFRVWSAGCSTGEEPYTLSMTLSESCLEGLGIPFQVTGTDVSTQALEKARKAIYPQRAVSNLAPAVLQRWFDPVDGGYRPVQRIRDRCTFHFHNLIKEPYPLALMSNWDVIFCRNVTIYFRVESTRRVVDHFFDALNPGGYLFIGHSETLTSISERFEPVEINGVFLYRKPLEKRALSFDEIVARRQERTGVRAEPKPEKRPRERLRVRRTPDPPTEPPVNEVEQLILQARAKLEQACPMDALVLANDAQRLEPDCVEAHLVAAFAYADLGKLDEALEQARAVLATYPLTAGARYIMGVIHQQRGDLGGALAEYKRTIYIDPGFVLAHFAVANIQRQQGDIPDACREYENTLRALHSNPEGAWTMFLGGFRPDLLARSCERSLIECGKSG